MNLFIKYLTFGVILSPLVTPERSYAQTTSNPLIISGYAEAYYTQDFNKPSQHMRPGFIYSHNRANEININLAYIKANYTSEQVRSNLALAAGTYMNANYSAEPGVLKNVYEANVGVKISKRHNLWIDAGIMPSHLGFESAVGKDNWTLTRSLFAENSPYFETGAKITYTTTDDRWVLSGLFLNGWQRIQRIDGNSTPAFGHQLTFKPNERLLINSGSFVGSDKADSVKQMRYFHNLYAIYQITDKWGVTAGFDLGVQQKAKGSEDYSTWYTPVFVTRYSPSQRVNIVARAEYYKDNDQVIISTGTDRGFQTTGFSLNVDYVILANVMWRTELRNLKSKDAIFTNRNTEPTDNSLTATTALTFSF
ncbi:porin [Sphingobacterium sp. SYP-B4668]|uniref:porin n=1 Tax=Sphingobacterium sp. SYP-B4668 TaxID=2996035 RepID=UPI0022DD8DFF|nr:porin [Sphingobacterium sp. SYP-B4668]